MSFWQGIDKKDTVINLSKTENGVVTAINGDFFSDYKNGQSFSLGVEVKDERLLQSHIQDTMAAGLWDENALDLTYIKLNSPIKCPFFSLIFPKRHHFYYPT